MAYDYQEQLDMEALSRYKLKLSVCGLEICPYKLNGDSWFNDPKEWPELQFHDLYVYLIKSPSKFTLFVLTMLDLYLIS